MGPDGHDGADADDAGRRAGVAVLFAARPHPDTGRRPSAAAGAQPQPDGVAVRPDDGAVGDHRGAAPGPHVQAADRPVPLCPGPTGLTSEVPATDYDVVVFENRFPSLSGAGSMPSLGDGFVSAPGNGRCE